jgi:hypothetical protein
MAARAGEAVQAFLRKRRLQDIFTHGEQKGTESGIPEEDVPEAFTSGAASDASIVDRVSW